MSRKGHAIRTVTDSTPPDLAAVAFLRTVAAEMERKGEHEKAARVRRLSTRTIVVRGLIAAWTAGLGPWLDLGEQRAEQVRTEKREKVLSCN